MKNLEVLKKINNLKISDFKTHLKRYKVFNLKIYTLPKSYINNMQDDVYSCLIIDDDKLTIKKEENDILISVKSLLRKANGV
jgi:hypothetical protein